MMVVSIMQPNLFLTIGNPDQPGFQIPTVHLKFKNDFPSRSSLGLRRRSSDIISMLVNIYGSKELFVNEYRYIHAIQLFATVVLYVAVS